MTTKRNDTRGLYLEVPGAVMDQLIAWAHADGIAVPRLVQGWIEGRVRDHGGDGP